MDSDCWMDRTMMKVPTASAADDDDHTDDDLSDWHTGLGCPFRAPSYQPLEAGFEPQPDTDPRLSFPGGSDEALVSGTPAQTSAADDTGSIVAAKGPLAGGLDDLQDYMAEDGRHLFRDVYGNPQLTPVGELSDLATDDPQRALAMDAFSQVSVSENAKLYYAAAQVPTPLPPPPSTPLPGQPVPTPFPPPPSYEEAVSRSVRPPFYLSQVGVAGQTLLLLPTAATSSSSSSTLSTHLATVPPSPTSPTTTTTTTTGVPRPADYLTVDKAGFSVPMAAASSRSRYPSGEVPSGAAPVACTWDNSLYAPDQPGPATPHEDVTSAAGSSRPQSTCSNQSDLEYWQLGEGDFGVRPGQWLHSTSTKLLNPEDRQLDVGSSGVQPGLWPHSTSSNQQGQDDWQLGLGDDGEDPRFQFVKEESRDRTDKEKLLQDLVESVEDEELLECARKAVETNDQSLVTKIVLKRKVHLELNSRGKTLPDLTDFPVRQTYELRPEEKEREAKRKLAGRVSAKTYRDKMKRKKQEREETLTLLEQENQRLQMKVDTMTTSKSEEIQRLLAIIPSKVIQEALDRAGLEYEAERRELEQKMNKRQKLQRRFPTPGDVP